MIQKQDICTVKHPCLQRIYVETVISRFGIYQQFTVDRNKTDQSSCMKCLEVSLS